MLIMFYEGDKKVAEIEEEILDRWGSKKILNFQKSELGRTWIFYRKEEGESHVTWDRTSNL